MHRAAPLLSLPAGDIHLWFCPHGESGDPALDASYRALLTPEELQQKDRFHFARDQHRYLLTRVLVRTVLSRYAPIAPQDWRFANGPFGRPRIDDDVSDLEATRGLDFNLSHTAGLIVLAMARDIELGVDVENIRRPAVLEAVDHFFAPAEARSLNALPAALQPHRFFELWTLKESYIKARGMGLQIPLDSFAFALDVPGGIGFSLADPLGNAAWHFQQLQPTPDHMVALCSSSDARIVCRETAPLQWERSLEVATKRASKISPLSPIPPS